MNRPLRPFLSLVFALTLLLCLLLPAPALALNPGDEFFAINSDGKVIQYRVSTPGEVEVIISNPVYTGDIDIPTTVDNGGQTYKVTGIGDSAFQSCMDLTSVTIPNSVQNIGYRAFQGCEGLKSVTIPGSVQSIGEFAFTICTGLTSVTLQDGVESIGEQAFSDCTGLRSVTIPASVQGIGEQAFSGCTGLTSITLQDGVESIGQRAFAVCTGLRNVTIPGSVKSIGEEAFSDCMGLKSVTLEEGVTAIGEYAFRGCTGLAGVTIPASVKNMGEGAFSLCTGLQSVTLQDGVQSIGEYAFRGCTSLTGAAIPASVQSIGEYAFSGCTNLQSVTLPDSVQSIGTWAFANCTGLASVTFLGQTPPDMEAGAQAFYGCAAGLVFYVPAGSEAAYRAALIKTGLANPIINPSFGSANYTHGLYPMLSGDGAAWPGAGTLQFTSAGPYSGFQWASVDGAVLPTSAYTVTEGSTVLALQPDYLAILSAGAHKLTMQFSGGYSEASFTTGAALVGPPKTGEQAQPWAVLALGVAALAGVWACLSRRKVK